MRIPARLYRLGMLTAALFMVGCEQDMVDQPKYEPYEASALFPNGQSSRPLVAGTVARSTPLESRPVTMPFKVTPERLHRGQERFNIYCVPCHSVLGDGEGMIVQRGFPHPPSYHEERLRQAPDVHYYDVITNGYGVMYSYAARVAPDDRWAIVAYIRALQLSQHANTGDVPPGTPLPAEETRP